MVFLAALARFLATFRTFFLADFVFRLAFADFFFAAAVFDRLALVFLDFFAFLDLLVVFALLDLLVVFTFLGFATDLAGLAWAGAVECTANIAPWGSMHWAMRSPPGTSIGPLRTLPPSRDTAAAALSASGTLA